MCHYLNHARQLACDNAVALHTLAIIGGTATITIAIAACTQCWYIRQVRRTIASRQDF
jgi:hypothetical protein